MRQRSCCWAATARPWLRKSIRKERPAFVWQKPLAALSYDNSDGADRLSCKQSPNSQRNERTARPARRSPLAPLPADSLRPCPCNAQHCEDQRHICNAILALITPSAAQRTMGAMPIECRNHSLRPSINFDCGPRRRCRARRCIIPHHGSTGAAATDRDVWRATAACTACSAADGCINSQSILPNDSAATARTLRNTVGDTVARNSCALAWRATTIALASDDDRARIAQVSARHIVRKLG